MQTLPNGKSQLPRRCCGIFRRRMDKWRSAPSGSRCWDQRQVRPTLDSFSLYLSFFLIAAAAALSAMLLRLQSEQRSVEAGVMLASGFRPGQINRIGLAEGAAVAVVGTLVGLPLGVIYNACIIAAMNRWWMQPWDNTRL